MKAMKYVWLSFVENQLPLIIQIFNLCGNICSYKPVRTRFRAHVQSVWFSGVERVISIKWQNEVFTT